MRTNLYIYRHSKRLSQAAIAAEIGCNRVTYAAIENGTRNGSGAFWGKFQKAYPDANIGELMKVDERQTQNDRPID